MKISTYGEANLMYKSDLLLHSAYLPPEFCLKAVLVFFIKCEMQIFTSEFVFFISLNKSVWGK